MRYFFHFRSEDDEDLEGIELPSLSVARNEAVLAARETVAELVMQNERIDGKRFDIADGDGTILVTVAFSDVMNL